MGVRTGTAFPPHIALREACANPRRAYASRGRWITGTITVADRRPRCASPCPSPSPPPAAVRPSHGRPGHRRWRRACATTCGPGARGSCSGCHHSPSRRSCTLLVQMQGWGRAGEVCPYGEAEDAPRLWALGDRGQGLTVAGPFVPPARGARLIRTLKVHDLVWHPSPC
jgi:hypothetical protein